MKVSKMKAAAIALAFACAAGACAAGRSAYAAPEAVLRASGDLPSAKTERTVKSEKELEKLTEKEKTLKELISAATINRSKLLAAKRADLKLVRQGRDDIIKKEIEELKAKKAKQAQLVSDLKRQLTALKKTKNQYLIASMEFTIKLAQIKLNDIAAQLKRANEKLSQSYKDYKRVYDELTYLDGELKKTLDGVTQAEVKIKAQKADLSAVKKEYNAFIKSKDFLSAENRMDSLVFIQTGINQNYESVLDIRLKFKSDYYELVVNYKI